MGNEWNVVRKEHEPGRVRVALAFPDTYEIGMSNLGSAIMYHEINGRTDALAERVYAPWVDMEDRMRQAGVPLFALESRHPVRDFDILGFSLQYELSYTNVLNMLDLAGIPLLQEDRTVFLEAAVARGDGRLGRTGCVRPAKGTAATEMRVAVVSCRTMPANEQGMPHACQETGGPVHIPSRPCPGIGEGDAAHRAAPGLFRGLQPPREDRLLSAGTGTTLRPDELVGGLAGYMQVDEVLLENVHRLELMGEGKASPTPLWEAK